MRSLAFLLLMLLGTGALGQTNNATDESLNTTDESLNTTDTSMNTTDTSMNTTDASLNTTDVLPIAPDGDDANTTSDVPDCYSNLTDIQALVEAKSPFVKETYILCPNTEFRVGFTGGGVDGFDYVGGSAPIDLRSNSRYLCGADGSSSNNCTLVGGQFQLVSVRSNFGNEDKTGIVVQGLTFVDGTNAGALMVAPGDVTFIDCIFRNHENIGAVSLIYIHTDLRRKLEESDLSPVGQLALTSQYYSNLMEDREAMKTYKESVKQEHRDMQSPVELVRQSVTFEDCIFESNTYGARSGATNYGVITAETSANDLILNNCIFSENDFGDRNIVTESFAIFIAAESTIDISNTCFSANDVVGRATVVIEDKDSLKATTGVYGTFDAGLTCQYISFGAEQNDECLEYDSTQCLADASFTIETGPTSGCTGFNFAWSMLTLVVSAWFFLLP